MVVVKDWLFCAICNVLPIVQTPRLPCPCRISDDWTAQCCPDEVNVECCFDACYCFQSHIWTAFEQVWNILLAASHPLCQYGLGDTLPIHSLHSFHRNESGILQPFLILSPPFSRFPPFWRCCRLVIVQKFSCLAHGLLFSLRYEQYLYCTMLVLFFHLCCIRLICPGYDNKIKVWTIIRYNYW